jgi:hypothetical protein
MQIIDLGMTDLAQKNSLIGGSEIQTFSPHKTSMCNKISINFE